jgi:hypothetical protein
LPSPVFISAMRPAMEDDAADQLDVVMALAEGPLGRLAHRREGLRQQLVEALAPFEPLAEDPRPGAQIRVGELRELAFEVVRALDEGKEPADRPVVRGSENLAEYALHRPDPDPTNDPDRSRVRRASGALAGYEALSKVFGGLRTGGRLGEASAGSNRAPGIGRGGPRARSRRRDPDGDASRPDRRDGSRAPPKVAQSKM